MSGGLAFDPAEFAAFKAGLSGSGGGDRQPAPAVDVFDPAEFAQFKTARSRPETFGERFAAAAAPMSRAEVAPKAAGGDGQSISGDQAAADRLFTGMRRTADEALIGKPSLENQVDAGLFRGANAMALNAPRNMMAAAESLRTGQPFDRSYEYVKDVEDALARQYPKTALGGTVGGIVGGAVALPAFRAAEGAGIAGRGIANLKTGAAYAGLSELADTKDFGHAAIASGVGGVLGGVGGAIIDKAAPVVSRLFTRNVPFRGADGALTDEAATALRGAGVDPALITPEMDAVFAAKGPSLAAAREAQAIEQGISLSRGQATQDPRALDLEARAMAGRSGERAQRVAQGFEDRQAGEIGAARDRFLGMAAGDQPRVGSAQEAYETVAAGAQRLGQAQAERESVAQRGVDDALRAVRGRGGVDAIDGAEAAIGGVRDAAEAARGAYRSAYGEVGQIPGTFMPGAMDRVGSRVRVRLGNDVPIDDVLTPAATRAIRDLDDVPGLFNLKPGEGPDLQQVEQLRKRLVAYRGATGANATDRRAVDRILSEFDGHVEDAMGAGLFGQRPTRAGNPAADGVPGAPGSSAGAAPFPAAGARPDARSEPLTHYLARNGGIALDGDARAADLGRVMTPFGPLGRRSGRPIEDFRDQLASEGFIRPDSADGVISRRIGDEVHDLIGIERGGNPVYRLADMSRGAAERDVGGRLADQSAAYAERLAPFRQQVADDLVAVGVDPRHVDAGHLDDAAQRLFHGEHASGADAYEAAVLARGADDAGRALGAAHEIPFDGATWGAVSDALPGGDTVPLAAMQRARGLFREYKQAFAPRGPGDVAGQRLQRIVDRDVSPNEVSAMLFGSPGTGRVQSGQIQTLARVREAVGADSEAWRATQQALVARHLGGEGRDLGGRIDYLLNGDGRSLLSFLSGQQQAGLRALKGATRQLENARQGMPEWISDLERTGFDPNAVARSIFGGSGAIGSKPGAVLEAQAARGLLGPDSPEWAALRQAAVHRLIDRDTSGTRMVTQLRDFTEGMGKGVASALFNADELSNLRRFAAAVQSTIRPDGTLRPEAGARAEAVKAALERIGHMVALYGGGWKGIALSYGAKVARDQASSRYAAGQARRSFEGGAPRALAPPPMLPLDRLAAGEGLAIGQR